MKADRPTHLAVVIGRNRRVYARIYKMVNRIDAFSKHYYAAEIEKSRAEGFIPVNMKLEKPNDTTWIFRISYNEINPVNELIKEEY